MKLENKITENFSEYANYVNYERAIPHLYDGLKPVARRILYVMWKMKLLNKNQTKKSSNIVGQTMVYHPHGDASIYAALVRLTQDFSNNLPLIQGRGNFGSLDNDPAAMRYTEAKLSATGESLVKMLGQDLVDFRPNFDGTETEPIFLLPEFPLLLVNGAMGIGVGMSVNIPGHNLNEIIDATIACYQNKITQAKDLLTYISGPDFNCGCAVVNKEDFEHIYNKGKGSFKLRAQFNFSQGELVITNFPFKVSASKIEMQLAELTNLDILSVINTTSNKEELRIRIKRNINQEEFIRWLCANTSCEVAFPMELRAIDPATETPMLFSFHDFLKKWLMQYIKLLTKDINQKLTQLKRKLEITIGLIKAIKHIDEIIATIKQSDNRIAAKQAIIDMGFSDIQAEAILNIRLSKLTKLDAIELNKEEKNLQSKIDDLNLLLSNQQAFDEYVVNRLSEQKKYGQKRRSQIINAVFPKIVKRKSDKFYVTTHSNYVKIHEEIPRGKYITGDRNNPIYVLHDNYITPIKNANETIITNVHTILENDDDIFHVSVDGLITRTKIENIKTTRKAKAANQEVFTAFQAQKGYVLITTKTGKKVQFNLNQIKPTGRNTKGVIAVKLGKEQLQSIRVISTPEDNVKTQRAHQF